MADALNDVSTDVDAAVRKFIAAMEKACAKLHFESKTVHSQWLRAHEAAGTKKKKRNEPDVFPEGVRFKISQNKKAKCRTAKQQAEAVLKGGSWVCWGAHMSDKARHVIMSVEGTAYYGLGKCKPIRPFKKQFIAAWGKAMSDAGLLNFKSEPGYRSGDEFHLELPDARLKKSDERARACMEHYVRETRKNGRKKNTKFEKSYKGLIEKTAKRIKVPVG